MQSNDLQNQSLIMWLTKKVVWVFFPFSVYLDEEDNCLLNIYDLKNMRNNYLTGVFKKQKLKYFVFNSDLQ